jgi:Resolvase, N terminal domain
LKYFARIKLPESPHPPFVPRSVRYKDSDKRQLAAISAYAKANGFDVVGTYYDAAVSGADPVTDRAGFAEMLERLLSNGARTIIVESPDRFARDLMVQLAGHDMLKAKGIALIAASAPTFFLEDTRPPFWFAKSWGPSRNSRRLGSSPSLQPLGSASASRTANVRAANAAASAASKANAAASKANAAAPKAAPAASTAAASVAAAAAPAASKSELYARLGVSEVIFVEEMERR